MRHNFEQDIKKWEEERTRLVKEFSSARNQLCDKLQTAIGEILVEFEEETGFVAADIEVEIDKTYLLGNVKPLYSFRNVYVKLDVEEKLRE